MSFAVKGTQYRVSTPNLEDIKDFPYVFKWTKLPGKTVAISRVVVTLINPVEKNQAEIVFSVFSAAESFSRTFHSISDILRACDQVETQSIVKESVSKFYFDIKPPVILANKNDRIELHIKKKPNLAQENYTLCEGWMNDTEEVTVKDILRPAIDVKEDTWINEAVSLMAKHKVGYLLVRRDEDALLGRTAGIITETDLVEKVLGKGLNPKKIAVRDIMTTPIITVDSKTSLDEAVEMMIKKNIRRLPIEDKGKIIGIIIDRDIVRVVPIYFRGASKKRIFFPE
jgi:CBS domain-containing protein